MRYTVSMKRSKKRNKAIPAVRKKIGVEIVMFEDSWKVLAGELKARAWSVRAGIIMWTGADTFALDAVTAAGFGPSKRKKR